MTVFEQGDPSVAPGTFFFGEFAFLCLTVFIKCFLALKAYFLLFHNRLQCV